MMDLKELRKRIEEIDINYDYEECYNNLYNTCIDYMNDSQDWDLEYLFEDYIDYDTTEEIAKSEIERGGLIRLYYFLGDANLQRDMFRIDGYGNLEDVEIEDIKELKEEILETIDKKILEGE